MATYLGLANYLQNKFTGQSIWETSDWSKIDMGDGRTLQLNKHLMEGPHFISDPRKFLIDKLGYAPKEGSLQFMGKEYLTTDKVTGDISGPPMDKSISGRLSHAARSFATPIAATTIHDPLALGAGMGGFPIHGSTFESRIEEAPNRVRSSAEQRADEAAKRAKLAGKDPEEARKRVLGNIERDVNRATDRARKKKEDAERDIARRNIVSGP
jgi:hypothetical protein